MQDGELTNVSKINAGDEIINLGIIDKAEHTETSKLSMFTITKGKCLSAAFYWYRWETNLWVIKAKNS